MLLKYNESMPQRRQFVSGALFDVRPVDDTGVVLVSAIAVLPEKVDLRPRRAWWQKAGARKSPRAAAVVHSPRDIILRELQQTIARDNDPRAVLASAGVIVRHERTAGHPRIRPIRQVLPEEYREGRLLSAIRAPLTYDVQETPYEVPVTDAVQAAPEPEPEVVASLAPTLQSGQAASSEQALYTASVDAWLDNVPRVQAVPEKRTLPALRALAPWLLTAALVIAGLLSISRYGIHMKARVIQEGNAGAKSLSDARADLERLDFAAAADSFARAYEEFSRAGEKLNTMSLGLGSLVSGLPGGSAFKSANALVQVGKLVADSGKSMSDAVQALSKSGVILNPGSSPRTIFPEVFQALKRALSVSDKNLAQAGTLLAAVDQSVIPEDKRAVVSEFKDKLPEFQKLVAQGTGYADFLEKLVAGSLPRRYLLLFQNSSELRPTGGFAGTYGVVTFQNGQLKDFSVDDIYNLDGQLRELIVPPRELQHITPNWAMRDVSWFVDFPTSAKKVSAFFKKEAGYDVDGVITVNPKLVSELLKVTGPIALPDYDMTVDAENFLAEIQAEVEYGKNKEQNKPKQIVTDLAPRLLMKLYSADSDAWLNVVNALVLGLERKDVLMYFKDQTLERFVDEKGFAGKVAQSQGDYLTVTFSNVKGSKTDAVTDSSVSQKISFDDKAVTHTLTITRRHNGGDNKYGFYNRQNSSYVRVLVPDGAQLVGISGNSKVSFNPLMNYSKMDFTRDADLSALEATYSTDASNDVTVFRESGKTGFGFWMMTDPGEIKTVELTYTTQASQIPDYSLYVQKQPGLELRNFEFAFRPPAGARVERSVPELQNINGQYIVNGKLDRDVLLTVRWVR